MIPALQRHLVQAWAASDPHEFGLVTEERWDLEKVAADLPDVLRQRRELEAKLRCLRCAAETESERAKVRMLAAPDNAHARQRWQQAQRILSVIRKAVQR